MELNGTIPFLIMAVIIQNLQRTGPRMLEVNGVGHGKFEKYGDVFLAVFT